MYQNGDKFHTKDPQLLSASVKNLVTMVTWHLHLCIPSISIKESYISWLLTDQ